MKLRKTRIKKTTKANGAVQYIPEYKWGFWWFQFKDSEGPCVKATSIYYAWAESHLNMIGSFKFSIEEAKTLIKYYINEVEYHKACKLENENVKVEYEDYP